MYSGQEAEMTVSFFVHLKINESRRIIYCHLVKVSFWIHCIIILIWHLFICVAVFNVCSTYKCKVASQGHSIDIRNKPLSFNVVVFSFIQKMFCFLPVAIDIVIVAKHS